VNYYLHRRYGYVWYDRPSSRLLSWPRRLHRPVYTYECARCGLMSGPVRAWFHQMRCR
jgi:hypothetical protein